MNLTMDLLGYTWDFEFFVAAFLFGLGLATLGSGLFTAYFGAGKSQQIGFALIVLAVLVLSFQLFFMDLLQVIKLLLLDRIRLLVSMALTP